MSLFLSEKIKEKGGEIKLHFKVDSVNQFNNRVCVTSSKGERI